jgi:hypothetical protein
MEIVEKHLTEDTDYIILACKEVASQINDGFSCFVWISTYFTGTGLM